jgi:DNA-binding MarR family transcriptional regulator
MARSKEPPLPELSDRLHSAAIHLLRRLRAEDDQAGLSAPRLSALSVLVFRGQMTLGDLARAEQIRPPSMTRLVRELEASGLVETTPSPDDARSILVRATRRGVSVVQDGRSRRVRLLQSMLDELSSRDREAVSRSVEILSRMLGRES